MIIFGGSSGPTGAAHLRDIYAFKPESKISIASPAIFKVFKLTDLPCNSQHVVYGRSQRISTDTSLFSRFGDLRRANVRVWRHRTRRAVVV